MAKQTWNSTGMLVNAHNDNGTQIIHICPTYTRKDSELGLDHICVRQVPTIGYMTYHMYIQICSSTEH